jgi:hypothetical protein
MAYEYRVIEAEDGTFPVELWSSKGGRQEVIYRTRGFPTRQLAEAWIVPVQLRTVDPSPPRSRVIYLKPSRDSDSFPARTSPLSDS